jgi:hypothetical protein
MMKNFLYSLLFFTRKENFQKFISVSSVPENIPSSCSCAASVEGRPSALGHALGNVSGEVLARLATLSFECQGGRSQDSKCLDLCSDSSESK